MHLGAVDHVIGCLVLTDVVVAISYLRERAQWEKLSGVWREITNAIDFFKRHQSMNR